MIKMTICKVCGGSMVKDARRCPHCGASNNRLNLKGICFFMLLVVMIGGCANHKKDDKPAKVENKTENVEQTETKRKDIPKVDKVENNEEMEKADFFTIGEEVQLKDKLLKVNSIEKSMGNEWFSPKEGKEFVIVNVTIKNAGDKEMNYNSGEFKMQNSQGEIVDISITTLDKDTHLSYGKLAPGGETTGTMIFEQPIDDNDLTLRYTVELFGDKEIKVKLN